MSFAFIINRCVNIQLVLSRRSRLLATGVVDRLISIAMLPILGSCRLLMITRTFTRLLLSYGTLIPGELRLVISRALYGVTLLSALSMSSNLVYLKLGLGRRLRTSWMLLRLFVTKRLSGLCCCRCGRPVGAWSIGLSGVLRILLT